jgi:protein-ribulosamine 3-kinase
MFDITLDLVYRAQPTDANIIRKAGEVRMHAERLEGLVALISNATGAPAATVSSSQVCSGGCIHHAEVVELSDGRRFFVKSNQSVGDMFAQEALALAALAQVAVIRVPRVIAVGMLDEVASALVLEEIQTGKPAPQFWENFGSQFAALHHQTRSSRAGWASDNYIGSNLQRNDSRDSWTEFYAECRLTYQLRLARNNSLGSNELFRLSQRLIDRLGDYLDASVEPMVLLHGDLWGGNYLVDRAGQPVLIDPASYYGHREADLAMPLLFGGFPAAFIDGYNAAWPLADNWRDRVEIYKLYHLINHLNLFGSGYLEGCLEIVRRYA